MGGELAAFLTIAAIVKRPRPDVPHLDSNLPTSAFPSGHMAAPEGRQPPRQGRGQHARLMAWSLTIERLPHRGHSSAGFSLLGLGLLDGQLGCGVSLEPLIGDRQPAFD